MWTRISEDVTGSSAAGPTTNWASKTKGKTPEADFIQRPTAIFTSAPAPKTARPCTRLEPFYASDYFDQIYEYAVTLDQKRQSVMSAIFPPEDTDRYRGAPNRPGQTAPSATAAWRKAWIFSQRMKAGEFPDGSAHLARQN